MEKKKLNLIAGVLIVIFIFLLFSLITRPKAKIKKPRENAQLSTAVVPLPLKDLEEYFANLGIPRNPFTLGGKVPKWREEVKEERRELTLNAIVWDEIQPLAVINNEVVSVGQELAGLKVISIDKDKVIVKKDGETIELVISLTGGVKP